MANKKDEYELYHSSTRMKKERAKRNKARRKMKRKHGFLDRLSEVDHIDGNPNNNSDSNLRIVSRGKNRKKQ